VIRGKEKYIKIHNFILKFIINNIQKKLLIEILNNINLKLFKL